MLERVGPGGFLGEMVLIDDLPRGATGRATTDVRVVPIDEAEFVRLIEVTPRFALEVMRVMAKRLRHMLARAGSSD